MRGDVVTVHPDDTLAVAGARMKEHRVGCLVVTDTDGHLAGILSERDIVVRVLGEGVDPAATSVREIMTHDVACCRPGTSMREAQRIMARRHIRHLPVVEDGRPVGMISTREVLQFQHEQDVAMRQAAEQVAKLYASLRSMDFADLVDITACEVPCVIGARRAVLCLPAEERGEGKAPQIRRHACPCPENELRRRNDAKQAERTLLPVHGKVPEACAAVGAGGKSLVLPLGLPARGSKRPQDAGATCGYLCICDFQEDTEISRDLTAYKIGLLHDTIGANLVRAKLFEEYQRAKQAALTDALTGLGTRRLIEEELARECARSRRYGTVFSLAFVDVDRLKLINDRLGHNAGDEILIRVGQCMHQQKRTTDALARYGGDEFVVLMPETSLTQSMALLERIRQQVQSLFLPGWDKVTVSIGVVEQDSTLNLSPDEVVRRADMALYHVKRAGRNQIGRWDEVPEILKQDPNVQRERIEALRDRVTALMAQSREMFMQSIWGLVQALDARDPHTKSHSENVMRYAVGIAEHMGVEVEEIGVIRRAAIIHDVGKIGIPDAILCKPGPLAEEERRTMEEHPLIGVGILNQMKFLEREIPLVRHHHERWDGEGYPDGLGGPALCVGARILAVADALDAITSTRNYHDAKALPEAFQVLEEGTGSQFDPAGVEALQRWMKELRGQLGVSEPLTTQHLLDAKKDCTIAA